MSAVVWVPLLIAFMGGTATVSATVLPMLIRMRTENHSDHNRVIEALTKLTTQVAVLERDLQHHVKWEESQKYLSGEEIKLLVSSSMRQEEHLDQIQANAQSNLDEIHEIRKEMP